MNAKKKNIYVFAAAKTKLCFLFFPSRKTQFGLSQQKGGAIIDACLCIYNFYVTINQLIII